MRKALGETKEAFGKRLGVSGGTIATWERRGTMGKENHRMLAQVYEQLRPLIVTQDKFLKTVGLITPPANVTDFASAKARRQLAARTLMAG